MDLSLDCVMCLPLYEVATTTNTYSYIIWHLLINIAYFVFAISYLALFIVYETTGQSMAEECSIPYKINIKNYCV
jgi:hypothetical protein